MDDGSRPPSDLPPPTPDPRAVELGKLRRKRKRTIAIAGAVVGVLILGVLGQSISSDDSPTSALADRGAEPNLAELGDAFGAELRERSNSSRALMTQEEAGCVGRSFMEAVVGGVGYKAVVAAGVTPESFESLGTLITNEQFDLFFLDGLVACTDFVEQLAKDVGPEAGWTEGSEVCMFETLLADPKSRQLIATGIMTLGDLRPVWPAIGAEKTTGAMFSCFPDEELAYILGVGLAAEVGVSEGSMQCFFSEILSDSARKDALRQWVATSPGEGILETLSEDSTIGSVVHDGLARCLTNAERLRVGNQP